MALGGAMRGLVTALVVGLGTVAAPASGGPAGRVVSLAPHLTELIYTAGAGDRLVGVVEYSDWPPAARLLPRVGDSMRLDLERIVAMQPDLIVAWQSGNSARGLQQLEQLGLRVVAFEPRGLRGIAADLRRLGELLGTAPIAAAAADDYIAALEARAGEYATANSLTVFYQIQDRPLYTVNGRHVISEVIELCGGRNVFAELNQLAPTVGREAVLERDPQVIITGDFGQPGELEAWRAFPDLSAVRYGNLYSVDANLIARSTTRIVEGVEQVCTVLDAARSRIAAPSRDASPSIR